MKKSNKYHIIICAVLFDVDKSLLGYDIGDNFQILSKSLTPKDKLDIIFGLDAIGLRREYETARLNDETLDVPCIYKEYDWMQDETNPEEYFDKIRSDILTYIDKRIRAIRLVVEGAIRFKKLAIKMESEKISLEGTKQSFNYSEIIPIGEAFDVIKTRKVKVQSIESLSEEVNRLEFPIEKNYLNKCHMLYDRSYLIGLPEAAILLSTCLEILFLKSENCKKERLSKRCATYLFDHKEDRLACYEKLKSKYKKRSDFVHDGNDNDINIEDVIYLRECVRAALIKLIIEKQEKSVLIDDLKRTIKEVDYWKC